MLLEPTLKPATAGRSSGYAGGPLDTEAVLKWRVGSIPTRCAFLKSLTDITISVSSCPADCDSLAALIKHMNSLRNTFPPGGILLALQMHMFYSAGSET